MALEISMFILFMIVTSGTVLVVIGSILCYYISKTTDTPVPQIWIIGLPVSTFYILYRI